MQDELFGSGAERWTVCALGLGIFSGYVGGSQVEAEAPKDARHYLWKLTWIEAAVLGGLLVFTTWPFAYASAVAMGISGLVVMVDYLRDPRSSIDPIAQDGV